MFRAYFPEVTQSSIILYNKKFQAREVQPSKVIHKKKDDGREDVAPRSMVFKKGKSKFQTEKDILLLSRARDKDGYESPAKDSAYLTQDIVFAAQQQVLNMFVADNLQGLTGEPRARGR